MLRKLIVSVCVAVIVTLACALLGAILITLKVEVAVTVGVWLKSYAGVLGVLAGLFNFATGRIS